MATKRKGVVRSVVDKDKRDDLRSDSDSNSDSDSDILDMFQPVFAKSSKTKKNGRANVATSASKMKPKPASKKKAQPLTQTTEPISCSQVTTVTADEDLPAEGSSTTFTPAEIEMKARKQIVGFSYPNVESINDLRQLAWHRSGKDRYPCRKIPLDEAKYLFPKLHPSKIPIEYLGKFWKHARKQYEAIKSTVHTMECAANNDMSSEERKALRFFDETDEQCLSTFLNNSFANDEPVRRRSEELVIRQCIEIVCNNQKMKKNREKEQERENKLLNESSQAPKRTVKRKAISQEISTESDEECDGDVLPGSPGTNRKKVLLRPGDVVEYYAPGRVFGRPDCLCRSEIIGINARANSFPLNLDSGDFLERDHQVRRIKKMHRGALITDESGTFRCVDTYALRTAGTTESVGLRRRVETIRQKQKECAIESESFWQKDSKDSTNSPKIQQENLEKDNGARKSRPTKRLKMSSSPTESPTEPEEPFWKKMLKEKIAHEEKKVKEKRRYVPKFKTEELQQLIRVWAKLQERYVMEIEFSDAVRILSDELEDISEKRIEAVLNGDPNDFLSERNKKEIFIVLQEWLQGK